MKKVIIIHGWDGYPEECWFQWLKKEMEDRGFQVEVPQMPDAATPEIEKWVPYLAELVGEPDNEIYLVGHSIGVQTILRYLESIDTQIGGVVAVAGFYDLIPGSIGGADDEAVAKPWLERPIDDAKVRENIGSITAIFSDNDPYVALDNETAFREKLGAKTIVEHSKGHMGGSDDMTEAPIVLEELLKIIQA